MQNETNTNEMDFQIKTTDTYGNIEVVTINKSKNGKRIRSKTFFVDGKKVAGHQRTIAENKVNEYRMPDLTVTIEENH